MNYTLNKKEGEAAKTSSALESLKKMLPLLREEKRVLFFVLLALIANSGANLIAPYIVGRAIDQFIPVGNYQGVIISAIMLFGVGVVAFVSSYLQITLTGGVGQRVLYRLRARIFEKLQDLPVAFFTQNQAGDLISRINNDTEKVNQFFSQSLTRFVGSIFMMIGAGGFLLALQPKLGFAALLPAVGIFLFTRLVSPWVRKKNTRSLGAVGGMSAEIQESLENFKVVVAFGRRDYFRSHFEKVNKENYQAAIGAGIANGIFTPVYEFFSNTATLIVVAYGIFLITQGQFTVGLLVSFISYAVNFYGPLRQLAVLWANFQAALSGWDRISDILVLSSNLETVSVGGETSVSAPVLEFQNVGFHYIEGKEVLRGASFQLERGKTYALVGPTGGGKTTTASLMARLYDPTSGTILLNGRDLRSYTDAERTASIGFILQDPFLFTGTIGENIAYGNPIYETASSNVLAEGVKEAGLDTLLVRFEQGLETPVASSGDAVSLGQKQLVAFMRATLRKPELLILDEATANIDTITEQLLEEVLSHLPKTTTRVVIAHRLNTIENADEIFFVNSGEIVRAGSMEYAVEMLLKNRRKS